MAWRSAPLQGKSLAGESGSTKWTGCPVAMKASSARELETGKNCSAFLDLIPLRDRVFASRCTARHHDDGSTGWPNGEWTKGASSRDLREGRRIPTPSNPLSGSRVPPRGASPRLCSPFLTQELRLLQVNPVRIECNHSNRIEWPLGTGRSPMHGENLKGDRRRSTHGPQGTAQGNRGSAEQGGVRTSSGSLPFQTSVRVRTVVDPKRTSSCLRFSQEPRVSTRSLDTFRVLFFQRSSS
jgi:hypothetical protein